MRLRVVAGQSQRRDEVARAHAKVPLIAIDRRDHSMA
jgi:hypothetical protein